MQRDRQTKKLHKLLLISLIAAAMACLFALPFGVLADDPTITIEMDIALGSITFTDTEYTYYTNVDGTPTLQTGLHDESNRYVIKQSTETTEHNISVESQASDFVIYLDGVNIAKQVGITNASAPHNQDQKTNMCTEEFVPLFVNAKAPSVVVIVLKDGSENELKSGFNCPALEKSGGVEANGTLVITCEKGYAEWQKDSKKGHIDTNGWSGCDETCGSLTAKSGNAWYETGKEEKYVAAAGIGTRGDGSGGVDQKGVVAGSNALQKLTIAGGRISAAGAYGISSKGSSGGAASIGVGAAGSGSLISGTVTDFYITGGTITTYRCDNSAACIGGGYRSGYVNIEIYGGTIIASDDWKQGKALGLTQLTSTTAARAAGIGGGGGGTSTGSQAGATVSIHDGHVTASSRFGAAIGGGGGGETGHAKSAEIYISGGEIHATTTRGSGNGAGAAIGTGGSTGTGRGGAATVVISGGLIFASSEGGADIGGGGTYSGDSKAAGGNGTVTISGGTVNANTGGIGGGLANAGTGGNATVIISGGTVSAASIGGGNSITNQGGTATVTVQDSAMVTLSGGIGGGDSTDPSTVKNGGTATVTVKNGTLTCSGIGGGNSAGTGNGGAAVVTVENGFLVANSIGGGASEGGKIGHAIVNISGGDIKGQFIMAEGAEAACQFTMTGGSLHDVDATDGTHANLNGGAIYMDDPNGVVSISGGTITNCSAQQGGAIYMSAGTCTVSGTASIQSCSAEQGGAIYIGGGTCTVSGGEVNGNVATQNGGGVYMEEGTFALSGGKVTKNIATQNGGGVYLGGGNMTMSLGELSENEAQSGAGAYVQAADENEGIFVSGGLVTSNIAQENGGGFVVLNGSYKMTGGVVENNDAAKNGGGIYVASTGGAKVTVEFRSGTVRNNEAGVNGGAFAVVGQKDGSETIAVTIGVNQTHFDEEGNEINCEHGYQNTDLVYTCPVFENNRAAQNGGAIYITGGSSTKLETFCLEETGSTAVGNGKSNFMMVEGGTVTLTTADSSGNDWVHGKITITREIHVVAGDMLLDGSMSNPLITAPITVDVDKTGGSFADKRENASTGKQYYKIQYFENFIDPETNKETGQYTVFQVEGDTQHVILYTLYIHDGYDIKGWWTQDTDGNPIEQYIPNTPYTITKDLMLYAKWVPIGYYVKFEAGADDFRGTMPTDLYYEYDKSYTLPLNGYFVKGKLFVGWYYGEEALLTDGQSVSNLTLTRNVTLTAMWKLCLHEDEGKFTYTVEGDDTLVRTCYCEACIQYAQLIAEDRDYDPDAARYEAVLNCYDDPSNQGISPTWSPVRSYSGEKYSMVPFDPSAPDFRIGAGKYTVSITGGATTLEVKFEIRKAKQAPPDKPTYNTAEDANMTNKITIESIATNTERLVYLIKWYDENGVLQEYDSWLAYAEATATGFELSTDYTNYYVYAKFAGDDNYLESVTVMADAVLFFTGLNINVYFICENGIHYTAGAIEGQRGLQIDISAVDGYFLYDTTVTQDCPDASLQTVTTRKTYRIDLPNSKEKLDITVTINGVKKQTAVGAEIEAAEEFGEVKGTSAVIAKDSAYTVAFVLENYQLYTDLALQFGGNLPVGTTVILIDKTNTNAPVYYRYLVETPIQTIPLANSFLRMGSPTQRFTPPASSIDPLHYQLIIDFSDVDGGYTADTLTTALTATISTEEINKGAQAFPQKEVAVTLKEVVSSIGKTAESGMSTTLTVSYADAEGGAKASKWERRAAVLVLKATTALPVDARLEAIDSKQERVLRNSTPDGLFILPIQNEGEITITLLSDLLPTEPATYTFEVAYLSACSLEGRAPVNGFELDNKMTVTFTKAADAAEPSANLTGTKQIYDAGETVKVTVAARDYGDADLGLRLLVKQNGVYVDTSWQPTGTVTVGENEVPIGTLTGSCCILLEIKSNETVLLSVPYYFVVRETAQE